MPETNTTQAHYLARLTLRGVLAAYMTGRGGPMEFHITNPKKYMCLKF